MSIYTNVILTVIAVALSIIALRPYISPANADGQYQKVIICDHSGRCAKIDPSFDALTVKDPL